MSELLATRRKLQLARGVRLTPRKVDMCSALAYVR
jgi:hypothetical protein